ncbi:MAG TPA: sulfate ABC transporter substrate-binding protein [Verrucomicrobiae bacterium]|nr:sulfate ABC transporter substrate-binding protein [Verrucomicrobiae bacterium]
MNKPLRLLLSLAIPAVAVLAVVVALVGGAAPARAAAGNALLNVSYDPTRELYQEINTAFAKKWQAQKGTAVSINQSHGGSGKQARAVIDGLEGDVVTLALAYDIDNIAKAGLLPRAWQGRLPQNSCPYTSTIVFLVRAGNPKKIKDWEDLGRPGIQVITPNPKTSGGARWNYLAAWGAALKKPGGNDAAATALLTGILKNVPILDTGARGATVTFVERGIGDVLIAWENEALFAAREMAKGKVEIVVPSTTILAEPPVAVVDRVVAKHNTKDLAQAYLEFLFSPEGQEIAAKHYFRPRDQAIAAKHGADFPGVKTFTIDEVFGGWAKAQATHFADGGTFDRIMATK